MRANASWRRWSAVLVILGTIAVVGCAGDSGQAATERAATAAINANRATMYFAGKTATMAAKDARGAPVRTARAGMAAFRDGQRATGTATYSATYTAAAARQP